LTNQDLMDLDNLSENIRTSWDPTGVK